MFFLQVIFYKLIMQVLKIAGKIIPQTQPFIFSGKNSSLELTQLIIDQGSKHVLIVTDAILNELGIPDNVCKLLKANQIDVTIYDQVTPDPSESVVNNGIQIARKNNCDLVLGVGGGSSLDAAKMIAVLAKSTQTIKNVTGLLKIQRYGLPLFLLPTTSGTGSEVTMAAVITDTENQSKSLVVSPKMMATATALDPILMQGMPPKITADTGFDALTHAIESYLSTFATKQTDLYAKTAIKLIFKQLETCYLDGNNLAARQSLALASCYAGLAFNKANLGYVHAISHQIGAKYHSPHGFTNAVVLPVVLNFNAKACESRLAELASAIGLDTNTLDEEQAAQLFIQAVKTLQNTLGIPEVLTCIKVEDIPALAKSALKEAHYLYPVPKYLTQNQCEKLIKKLL
jgi:alcohol dehydrogenase